MTRILVQLCTFCVFVVSAFAAHSTSSGQAKPNSDGTKRSPNVLFILIDDFGWYDVGYNGSTFYETPRMDQLTRAWMRFDHCYTPSPMCSPTRASILTGKNPARHGITQWLDGTDRTFGRKGEKPLVYCPQPQSTGINESEITMGEAFQAAGYDTAFHGKWHMGRLKETGGPINHGYASQEAIIEANRCAMFHPFRNGSYFPKAKAATPQARFAKAISSWFTTTTTTTSCCSISPKIRTKPKTLPLPCQAKPQPWTDN